jgi:hypothetical protein
LCVAAPKPQQNQVEMTSISTRSAIEYDGAGERIHGQKSRAPAALIH